MGEDFIGARNGQANSSLTESPFIILPLTIKEFMTGYARTVQEGKVVLSMLPEAKRERAAHLHASTFCPFLGLARALFHAQDITP